jgi:DNA invertase Pin-like site-specific DNA recombinase
MKYGYARTSTDDQTTALQLAVSNAPECAHIHEDKGLTGATAKRPALTRCLRTLRAGDTLTVWKPDRLGRSLRDLITILDDLAARDVKFHSLTEAIDTTTPTGRAMWQMAGVSAELERSLISERARRSESGAAPGRQIWRNPRLNAEQIAHARKLIDKGEARQYVADLLNVGPSTLYRAIRL